jgi:hypothetical protein
LLLFFNCVALPIPLEQEIELEEMNALDFVVSTIFKLKTKFAAIDGRYSNLNLR